MTLKDQIQNELSTRGKASLWPQVFDVTTSDGVLEFHVTALDIIGCAIERIAFRSHRLANKSIGELKQLSESLAGRLAYLLEPIRTVETDRNECVVQLRSNPPQRDEDATSYYELLARSGEISLCRYTKPRGETRRVIPAHVTREVLVRLAVDMVDAVK